MVKMLVTYYSRSGHTKRMAEEIANAARDAGADVDLLHVDQVDVKKFPDYDCLVVGSPTYYGTMAAEVKGMFDKSVKVHNKLTGRLGGAFASSGMRAGGNETTVTAILLCWLVHGMLVSGSAGSDHYGPVAVGKPDEAALKACQEYGRRMVEQAKLLRG
ncbi:MAG: flavodoxin family protein [Thermoplasmata archaeon]|nr:flavodoxin family protein [Thermoplasmata archaeon]NIS10831.1 flavodoxin family protein [Thermoplasmata archaeon]NIS21420.1 flavodoxin family protein [Thermoplasmata archaeon]NIT78973.1 flavodoxin family protein [Thermoplasmata archaeon]NIU50472.1 flavodoxin family protein [Thermoplasmata archaeon]